HAANESEHAADLLGPAGSLGAGPSDGLFARIANLVGLHAQRVAMVALHERVSETAGVFRGRARASLRPRAARADEVVPRLRVGDGFRCRASSAVSETSNTIAAAGRCFLYTGYGTAL